MKGQQTHRSFDDVVSILENETVYSYLKGIIGSDLDVDCKYQKLISFFKRVGNEPTLEEEPLPRDLMKKGVERCLRRTVEYLSSKQEGGSWTSEGQNDFWETAYNLLFFKRVKNNEFLGTIIDKMWIEKGKKWVQRFADGWKDSFPVYDISLFVVVMSQLGFREDRGVLKFAGLLESSQNGDGGWNSNISINSDHKPKAEYSNVGATSFAIKALAETLEKRFEKSIHLGVSWIAARQNHDGSWNDGCCNPGEVTLKGEPKVTKTCDAIQGILIGSSFTSDEETHHGKAIEKAVDYIKKQEKPIVKNDEIEGWGWETLEITCLVLETLVNIPHPYLPLLLANAEWLLKMQENRILSPEPGAWVEGLTSRIALSFLEFYKRSEEFCVLA